MSGSVRHAVVRTRGAAPEALLRELVRFGVTDVLLHGGRPPLRNLPRDIRITCLPPEAPPPRPAERVLLCEGDAVLDFNLARLFREAAPCIAVRAGADTGIRLEGYLDAAEARPVPVKRLPGGRPRPALFLDRDGTINVDHGYVGTRSRFEWMPGALDAIRAATEAGWHVFVVTNQSGVARGLFDAPAVAALHGWMVDEIHRAGGNVDDIRTCPFHPEAAVARYRRVSGWRKPAPGMILDLIARWSLDPSRCVLVGDRPSDMQAANAAGVPGHLFQGGRLDTLIGRLLGSAAHRDLDVTAPVDRLD